MMIPPVLRLRNHIITCFCCLMKLSWCKWRIWLSNRLLSFEHCVYTKSWSWFRKCNLMNELLKTNEEWLLWDLTSDKISVKHFGSDVIKYELKGSLSHAKADWRCRKLTKILEGSEIVNISLIFHLTSNSSCDGMMRILIWYKNEVITRTPWKLRRECASQKHDSTEKKHNTSAVSGNNCMNILSYSSVIFLYRIKKI